MRWVATLEKRVHQGIPSLLRAQTGIALSRQPVFRQVVRLQLEASANIQQTRVYPRLPNAEAKAICGDISH